MKVKLSVDLHRQRIIMERQVSFSNDYRKIFYVGKIALVVLGDRLLFGGNRDKPS